MSTNVVLLCYLLAFVVAALALYWVGRAKWYWHVLSFAGAVALGLMPPIEGWSGPVYDVVVGCAFVVLLIWGIGEPLYDFLHLPHYKRKPRPS